MLEFRIDSKLAGIQVIREPGQILQILVPENVKWEEIRDHVNQLMDHDEIAVAENLWCNDDFERSFTHEDGCLRITSAK